MNKVLLVIILLYGSLSGMDEDQLPHIPCPEHRVSRPNLALRGMTNLTLGIFFGVYIANNPWHTIVVTSERGRETDIPGIKAYRLNIETTEEESYPLNALHLCLSLYLCYDGCANLLNAIDYQHYLEKTCRAYHCHTHHIDRGD